MSNNIEYEARVMVNKDQYRNIYNDFVNQPNIKLLTLTNYYFDDNNLSLKNHHMVLRIRSINESNFEMTLKVKQEHGDLEINQPLTFNECEKLLDKFEVNNVEMLENINRIKHEDIKYLTLLHTNRMEVEFSDHLLVIDENHYSNITDYDIEVESSSREKAEEFILKYCDKYSLEYKKDYRSKSRRAFDVKVN